MMEINVDLSPYPKFSIVPRECKQLKNFKRKHITGLVWGMLRTYAMAQYKKRKTPIAPITMKVVLFLFFFLKDSRCRSRSKAAGSSML